MMTNKFYQWNKFILILFFSISSIFINNNSQAADWSKTEVHYQYGKLISPSFAGGASAHTNIYTLQHASGWWFGDIFFFADSLHDNVKDGINDNDIYSEVYFNFSLSRLTKKNVSLGYIRDVGFILGYNWDQDAKVHKYLPGLRVAWDIPGFIFLNTDFMAYLDGNSGIKHSGAPKQSDTFLVDVNWSRPFLIGSQSFSFEGHIEYAGRRHNELGNSVPNHVLAQPQLRWDAGKFLNEKPDKFFVGMEYQYWRNKLGDDRTTESRPQFLAVWRF